MNKELLAVKNLNVTIGQEKILQNITFTLNKGDVLVVLGPNGAGKTTLLRALLHLIPSTGSIEWQTQKINYLPPQEFLNRQHMPPLTTLEFFNFKDVSHNAITEIIDAVDLPQSILEKQFNVLSTGQFQRMLIAWALVDKPDVLLFDESTSGIDVGGEETIYSLLHSLWKKMNLTMILVTHELSIVWEHATNIICLNKKMLCFGKPQKILTPEELKKLYGTDIKFYRHDHDNR